jgi:hypothetical protein
VFESCPQLSSVTFDPPSQVTNLPGSLFYACKCLKTLVLPDSVTAIAHSAFSCSSVNSIAGSDWAIIAGMVSRQGKVFCCFGKLVASLRIPSTVREIGARAFSSQYSLIDLSFDEGILKVGVSAFRSCSKLQKAAFPASLIEIEANAFGGCDQLQEITFAVGSQLQYIRGKAFSDCPLKKVDVPASIVEIDPSAFSDAVWPNCATSLFGITDHFVLSVDSRVLFRFRSLKKRPFIGSEVEVIGARAFEGRELYEIKFDTDSLLREIGEGAFAGCKPLWKFSVPASVEILGDRCFESCSEMSGIEFAGESRLKRIGESAFLGCKLYSITIPAMTEEIDGSAFVNCPLGTVRVALGNRNFSVEGNLLVTSNGTEIVRYFGQGREFVIRKKFQVLRKSSFEGCKVLDHIAFETGSEVERICEAALRDCVSLISIVIPSSVTVIEKCSFEGCSQLESCLITEDSSLVTIGVRAFDIPPRVGEIGKDCFNKCIHLYRFGFMSAESMKRVIGDRSVDEALDEFGVTASSCESKMEIED